jgi:AcrR family transcriptional regulator
MTEPRMTAEERRVAIVKAVLPLFARKGFTSTTTRELAEAAGVSEALLYKHFPSKESLYSEIQNIGCAGRDAKLEKLSSLEPSASSLVYIVYYLMRIIAIGKPNEPVSWEMRHRMVLNSCLEDGSFTRFLFQNRVSDCISKMIACLEAAEANGDLARSPVCKENRFRFAHHVAAMIAIMHLPEKPAIDYRTSREELLNQAVWFALRGIGLKDEAIAVHYDPKALAVFFGEQQG